MGAQVRTAAILTCIMSAGLLLWLGGVMSGPMAIMFCGGGGIVVIVPALVERFCPPPMIPLTTDALGNRMPCWRCGGTGLVEVDGAICASCPECDAIAATPDTDPVAYLGGIRAGLAAIRANAADIEETARRLLDLARAQNDAAADLGRRIHAGDDHG